MDSPLLAPDRSCIFLEVDGMPHYSRPNPADEQGRIIHTAMPRPYAEKVAADRRLRLARYEVCRVGGWELTEPGGKQLFGDCFASLLARQRITAG